MNEQMKVPSTKKATNLDDSVETLPIDAENLRIGIDRQMDETVEQLRNVVSVVYSRLVAVRLQNRHGRKSQGWLRAVYCTQQFIQHSTHADIVNNRQYHRMAVLQLLVSQVQHHC